LAASSSTEACPACGGPLDVEPRLRGTDRLHGTPGTFEVRVCPACGSGRTFPVVEASELGRLYPESYNAYSLPPSFVARMLATGLYRWYYRRALRNPPFGVLRRIPAGRLLDVGAGRGDLGVVLAREGWEVTGLEPSAEACAAARGRGVCTVEGTLTSADSGELGAGYDVVVFQHALEHVVEPRDDLRRAFELLRPGGLLLVALPNFGSWQSRRFGDAWFHLDLPRHRSHFTAAGLERVLRTSGFVSPEITTSTTADGLQASVQYRLYGRRRFRQGASRYVVVVLSLLLLPLTELANALGGGGDELGATAVRPDAR
jgi:SAM-dependent methyltransferase